jgi:HD-GYP domain-containing protein (c-di-GMP phosphodiesterase class II)
MQRIRIGSIRPGQTFPLSLFLLSGQKLLGAEVAITRRHLEVIRRYGDPEVYLAESVEELAAAGVVKRLDGSLSVGQRASEGLVSRGGTLLLEPGQEVEQHHLDAIQAGGGVFRVGGSGAPSSDRRERFLAADELVESLERDLENLPLRVQPASDQPWVAPADTATWPGVADLATERNRTVDSIRKLYARIEAGVPVSVDDFTSLIDGLLSRLAHYPTRFTQLALLVKGRDDYLPDHAYNTAVLAMSIATNLKWRREDVERIGLASLLFDLGMLLVPQRIRVGACELSEVDRGRVRKHPLLTLSMLQHVEGVPPIIELAALQHHERENGSGYPRGLRKDAICDYARVLGVADAFAATMGPRHYRKQKLPYMAMEETLRLASATVFWTPACRALVQSAGLFPVGSYVKLSSGQRAHVIGTNPRLIDRPILQLLDDGARPVGTAVDLTQVPKEQLAVVRAIAIDACRV